MLHGDATRNRADKITKIAANALGFVHAGDAGERRWIGFIAVCVCGGVEFGNWRDSDDFPALRFAHRGS